MKSKKIIITGFLDGSANSTKPKLVERILREKGHDVTLIDTSLLSRLGNKGISRYLPTFKLINLIQYFVEVCLYLISLTLLKKFLLYYLVVANMHLRANILKRFLKGYEVIICESSIDSFIFLKNLKTPIKIYDCATPVADELYYGGKLTKNQNEKFKKIEMDVYRKCDHLSFHWHSYANYVKKYYGDPGNIFTFDAATEIHKEKPSYNSSPKIVYLGYLGGYWINLSLLSRLTKIYPDIDVYGFPKPHKKYNLNYKGYAKPSVVCKYQFGLITLSKDRLRREGFSAKHIDYLSYGLPVLVPKWRTSSKDLKGTIYYDENNFLNIIKKYSKKLEWEKISNDAIQQAKKYNVENVAKEFIRIIEK